jgi:streptogramin lyase
MTGKVFLKRGLLLLMALLVVLAMTATPAFATLVIPVTGVTVSPHTLNLNVGATSTLTATVAPSNASQAVTWSSSSTSVATVNSSGVVTAVAAGQAYITATTADTNANGTPGTDYCDVTVTAATTSGTTPPANGPWVTGVTISPRILNLTVGATSTLTATVAPSNANQAVTWNSDNTGVATVDSNGVVTAVAPGYAHITATTVGTWSSGNPSADSVTVDVTAATTSGTTPSSGSTPPPATNTAPAAPKTYTVGNTYNVGNGPEAIAIDSSGDVWVANQYDGVTELSNSGATIGTYKGFADPDGIAIDASGDAWVTNYGGDYVTKLSPAGAKLGTYKVGDEPYAIAFDSNGNAWVTNWNGNSVTELSSSGAKLGTYNGLNSAHGIAIDSSGDVLVTDSTSNTGAVYELSNSGANLGTLIDGSCYPNGVAIDASGNVWVTNWDSNTVTELKVAKAIQVYVNGTLVQMDVAPKIVDGRILVQMRPIFEALGATVQWNPADKSIVAAEGNTIIKLQIGSTTAYKNGAPVTLAAPPIIVNGHTLVPTRFVSEAFGYNVTYDAANMRVDITSGS